jgi:ubiquitin conjugation factor E4 B
MRDPVILPMSRVVIDRSTIRSALLSKAVDPFNNVPWVTYCVQTNLRLKYEECVPDVELKARIDAWLAEGNVTRSDVMEVDQL